MAERDSLTRRLFEHVEQGTTDQADSVHRVPVDDYRDPERWQREMQAIFRGVPLVVAFSAQLPEPGAYRAVDAAGIPVLSVRQDDGLVKVFLNVCRHRGAQLCEAGTGETRRFTCPYHAWTYDRSGALVGMPSQENFGDLDRGTRGLTVLESAERAGMVFATVTPGRGFDLDDWLGDYAEVLDSLGLADMHFYTEREVVGPNWKVAYDGYVDGYHLDKLHHRTLGQDFMGSAMTSDAWGPHQRIAFPKRSITELRNQTEDEWQGWAHIGVVHTVFPHVSIAGASGVPTMVSQLFPGPTPDRSRTIQTHLVPRLPEDDDQRKRLDGMVDFLEHVVREEDYKTGLGIQAGLQSEANADFVFGRNERANQIFHQSVDRLLEHTR